jgi:GT2 family glycosyltransferase
VLADNGSAADELTRIEKILPELKVPVKRVRFDGPFNFAHLNRIAAREAAEARYLFLLNNDVFWREEDSLDELVAWASQDGVATVGFPLRFPSGGLQHGGLRAWPGGPGRLARIAPEQGEAPEALRTRQTFANTFAACLIPRAVFTAVGLRPLDLPNGFGDVAFCFAAREKRLRHLFLGHLEAVHLESASRGTTYEYWDECAVEREFPETLQKMLRADLRRLPPGGELGAAIRQAVTGSVREAAPWAAALGARAREIWGTLRPTPESPA